MYVLIKHLNKQNGNLCFAAESDSDFYIFKCDRVGELVSYTTSTSKILDICSTSLNNYLVCFGTNQIGIFDGTTLNEVYATSPVTTDLMIYSQTPLLDNNYYIWSKLSNTISRIEIVGTTISTIWSFALPFDFTTCEDAAIFYKTTTDMIIFKGGGRVLSIQDFDTYAERVSTTAIDENNFFTVSGDNLPFASYARTRQVWGDELEHSSSSSSSSSSSADGIGVMVIEGLSFPFIIT